MTLFVFGLGYSARAAVDAMRADAPELMVDGTTRRPEKAARLTRDGILAHIFDGTSRNPAIGAALKNARTLLVSVAPDEDGDPVLNQHGDDIARSGSIAWMCYFSTIGVYGDAGGAWIDETYLGDAKAAKSDRARWRLAAEVKWQRLAKAMGVPILILRLAGIYGPGRSNFDKLRGGRAQRVNKPGQVFNRIHAGDIGRVVALAAAQRLGGVYNLADDLPAPPQDVMGHAAELIGVTPPPEIDFATADLSPMARSFYADNKRVSNAAIKRALGIDLLYPTYREGLAAVLDREQRD